MNNMAKEKVKGPKSIPNRHLHARLSFLHQAATYLAATSKSEASVDTVTISSGPEYGDAHSSSSVAEKHTSARTTMTRPGGVPFYMSSQLRQVAQKAQIRLHRSLKHASCRKCHAMLVEGQSCRRYIENLSRGGRKPHADVLVIDCQTCGTVKRFPVGAKPQQRKSKRATTMNPTEPSQDVAEDNMDSNLQLSITSYDTGDNQRTAPFSEQAHAPS